jgi:hypothetical protein
LDAVLLPLDSEEPEPPPIAVIVVRPVPEMTEFAPLKFAGTCRLALLAYEAPPVPTENE